MCRAALVTSEHLVDNTLESLIAEGVGNQEFVYPMRYSSAVPVDIGNFFGGFTPGSDWTSGNCLTISYRIW